LRGYFPEEHHSFTMIAESFTAVAEESVDYYQILYGITGNSPEKILTA